MLTRRHVEGDVGQTRGDVSLGSLFRDSTANFSEADKGLVVGAQSLYQRIEEQLISVNAVLFGLLHDLAEVVNTTSSVGRNTALIVVEHDNALPVGTSNNGEYLVNLAFAQGSGVDHTRNLAELHGFQQHVNVGAVQRNGGVNDFLDQVNQPGHGLQVVTKAVGGSRAAVQVVCASFGLSNSDFLDVLCIALFNSLTRTGHEAIDFLSDDVNRTIRIFTDHRNPPFRVLVCTIFLVFTPATLVAGAKLLVAILYRKIEYFCLRCIILTFHP